MDSETIRYNLSQFGFKGQLLDQLFAADSPHGDPVRALCRLVEQRGTEWVMDPDQFAILEQQCDRENATNPNAITIEPRHVVWDFLVMCRVTNE